MLTILFSRDRGMQLEGTLHSFFRHCLDAEDARINVLYKATSSLHRRQYNQVKQESQYKKVKFIEEAHFRQEVLNLLIQDIPDPNLRILYRFITRLGYRYGFLSKLFPAPYPESYLLFLVDDNIFINDFSLGEIQRSLSEHQDAIGFSLRLGLNTTYCYALDKPQALPEFHPLKGGIMKYNWTQAEADFGYPLEVSSSIYRFSTMLPLLAEIPFSNPNTLEGKMAARAKKYRERKPNLLCLEKSLTFCAPLNIVQNVWDNRSSKARNYSSEHLATLFEAGYRMDIEAYNGFLPNACHQEIELHYQKTEVL